QLGFLPNNRPNIKGYAFYDYYEPAQSVGGDYFDYVPLRNKHMAIAAADVAGKGIPAALLMARLYSAARFHLLTQPTVAKAMTGLNREIASSGLGYRFITCVIAVLDPKNHQLTIANAGHMPPLLRHINGVVEPVAKDVGGLPLGVLPDQTFEEAVVPLKPGDTFVSFTDGITEAMNAANELYTVRSLSRYLSTGPKTPEDLVKGLIQDVEQFCDSRAQSDDMCLVCLQREV
ncbi:MAG: serine/threonine-protein phosphatase, partial [Planctomycetaceae bacterium]|nr:serine/threonine-protein phosphatase [Planctomycetaceae bacterium]